LLGRAQNEGGASLVAEMLPRPGGGRVLRLRSSVQLVNRTTLTLQLGSLAALQLDPSLLAELAPGELHLCAGTFCNMGCGNQLV
jgi:hypothetical protein